MYFIGRSPENLRSGKRPTGFKHNRDYLMVKRLVDLVLVSPRRSPPKKTNASDHGRWSAPPGLPRQAGARNPGMFMPGGYVANDQ
jgi:hypothetical protein